MNVDADMDAISTHGAYDWVPDFFQINYANANMTMDVIQSRYSNLTVVKRVEEVTLANASVHPFWRLTVTSTIPFPLSMAGHTRRGFMHSDCVVISSFKLITT